jgi:hypothetical protein
MVSVEWVLREENSFADDISKMLMPYDWMLNPVFFRWLDGLWGPHTCDVFTSNNNNHCEKFYSLYLCRSTAGVNAFGCDWSKDNNWVKAPCRSIGRVWRALRSQEARATVMIPVWISAPWWHLVAPDMLHMSEKVVDWV